MERKVAIVTGGARGIGRGCAHALAKTGFDLALVDILGDELSATAEEIRSIGTEVITFIADVSLYQRAQEIASSVVEKWDRIDFLLNNAGRSMPKGLLEIDEDEWDLTNDVNLKSCFNYCRAVAPTMLAQTNGGRIVSMSSMNAHSGGVTNAVSKFSYAAAKAGILGLTRALAKELGPRIHVNAICPGVIKTERGNDLIRAREPDLISGIALDRVGTPNDVAQMVSFLATSQPSFITGQNFIVDGFQWKI